MTVLDSVILHSTHGTQNVQSFYGYFMFSRSKTDDLIFEGLLFTHQRAIQTGFGELVAMS